VAPSKRTQYYYAGSRLVARKNPAGKAWYHTDTLGTVVTQHSQSDPNNSPTGS
jgi:hypothetical protein